MFMMNMNELCGEFLGYTRLYLPRIKWIILFGFLFFVLFYFLKVRGYTKKGKGLASIVSGILLSLECAFILVMTLFGRRIGEIRRYDFKPFESYYNALIEGDMEILLQIFMNIAMYIPFGFLLPCCFKVFEKRRYVIYVAASSSFIIEFIQIILKIGLFEIDDIINNTLGSIIGLAIYTLCVRIKKLFLESITDEK